MCTLTHTHTCARTHTHTLTVGIEASSPSDWSFSRAALTVVEICIRNVVLVSDIFSQATPKVPPAHQDRCLPGSGRADGGTKPQLCLPNRRLGKGWGLGKAEEGSSVPGL